MWTTIILLSLPLSPSLCFLKLERVLENFTHPCMSFIRENLSWIFWSLINLKIKFFILVLIQVLIWVKCANYKSYPQHLQLITPEVKILKLCHSYLGNYCYSSKYVCFLTKKCVCFQLNKSNFLSQWHKMNLSGFLIIQEWQKPFK